MKINPETVHTKFDIYVLIIFLIIILDIRNMIKTSAFGKIFFSYVILSRLARL